MKLLEKAHLNRIREYLFIFMFAFPAFPLPLTNILFIVFMTLTLFFFLDEKNEWIFSGIKVYLLFSLPFIPYAVEFLVYPHDHTVQFELEKKLLFFVAPVVFFMNARLKNVYGLTQAVNSFIASVAILSVVSFFYLLFSGYMFSLEAYQNGAFMLREKFEAISGLHPIYYGLFSTTASLWMVFYFKNYSRLLQWLLGICLIFMVLLNLLIAAKMPLIILVIGLLWIAHKKISGKIKLLVIYVSFLSILLMAVLLIPSLNNRFLEVIQFFNSSTANNTILERYVVFTCSKMVFVQDLFTGVGSRNAQNILDFCYVYFKFYKGYEIHLNSHNQYLTLGITYGIGVVVLFVALLILLFTRIRRYPLGFIFWCCTVLIMLTESILERQMGIYFFLLFGLLLVNTTYNKNVTMANPKKTAQSGNSEA